MSIISGNVLGAIYFTANSYDPFGDGSGKALYRLENNALDESGDYNGTATGVTYGTGVSGSCGVFGDSKYITVPMTRAQIGDNISISMWFKRSVADYEWLITIDGRREIYFQTSDFRLGARVNLQAGYPVSTLKYDDGLWHHVVANFVGAGATELYVDGELISSSTTTSTFSNTGSAIGRYPTLSTTYCFGGSIDQVRIFNRTLTQTEVVALYNEI